MAGLEWEGGFGLENWDRPLSLYMLLGGDISELLKMWLLFFSFFGYVCSRAGGVGGGQ